MTPGSTRALLAAVVCLATAGCGTGQRKASEPAAAPTILFASRSFGEVSDDDHGGVILAVWASGDIIWSADRLRGGSPFKKALVARARVEAARDEICSLLRTIANKSQFGPDSAVTTIAVRCDGEAIELISWHELFEQNPNLIATDHGITTLDGRDRATVAAGASAEYRQFREAWDRIRQLGQGLIPEVGDACDAPPIP